MRFTTSVAAIAAAAIPFTNAYYKGVNVGANNPDGSCKTQQDWENAFNALKGTSQHFTSFRVYAASDCNTLEYAAPAAIATGTQLLVGVWTEDAAHYSAEKAALRAAYQAHGSDWILAISVGSEDLYRGDTDANTLAQQIYDVRGMVNADGVKVEVGHVDTWTAWVNSANEAVIKAADFIGMDGYPYFQSSSIDDAYNTFWDSVTATRNQVDNVDPGKWVWVTETGWPVSGDNYGAAVASTASAQSYWNSVGCSAIQSTHFFWYSYQDYNESPSFGLFGQNGKQTYSVDC